MKHHSLTNLFKKVIVAGFLTAAVVLMFTGCPHPNNSGGNNKKEETRTETIPIYLYFPYASDQEDYQLSEMPVGVEYFGFYYYYTYTIKSNEWIDSVTQDMYDSVINEYTKRGLSVKSLCEDGYSDKKFEVGSPIYGNVYADVNENVSDITAKLSKIIIVDKDENYSLMLSGKDIFQENATDEFLTDDVLRRIIRCIYNTNSFSDIPSVISEIKNKVSLKKVYAGTNYEFTEWDKTSSLGGKDICLVTNQSFEELGKYWITVFTEEKNWTSGRYDPKLDSADPVKLSDLEFGDPANPKTYNAATQTAYIYKGATPFWRVYEMNENDWEEVTETSDIPAYAVLRIVSKE